MLWQEAVDQVQLNFTPDSLFILNVSVGFIMFGVALELKAEDFKRLFKKPLPAFLGILCQFILLPLFTFLLILLLKPVASMALGMILIAACPGGNISNFMTSNAKGNVALSVTLTAFATLAAIVLTPFNFALYANQVAPDLVQSFSIDSLEMVKTVFVLLAIPLLAGMAVNFYFPAITEKIKKPIKYLSILIFAVIVIIALSNNWDNFKDWWLTIFGIILIHNALAYLIGFLVGKVSRSNWQNTKTYMLETGIQNSGLGLVLVFNFFDGLGGIALIVAGWGIWHIVMGLTMSHILGRINRS